MVLKIWGLVVAIYVVDTLMFNRVDTVDNIEYTLEDT